jgi:hypothetical protein
MLQNTYFYLLLYEFMLVYARGAGKDVLLGSHTIVYKYIYTNLNLKV